MEDIETVLGILSGWSWDTLGRAYQLHKYRVLFLYVQLKVYCAWSGGRYAELRLSLLLDSVQFVDERERAFRRAQKLRNIPNTAIAWGDYSAAMKTSEVHTQAYISLTPSRSLCKQVDSHEQ